ncbi:MAG: ABC transporter permease [Mycoplasmoidaceae bacterium]
MKINIKQEFTKIQKTFDENFINRNWVLLKFLILNFFRAKSGPILAVGLPLVFMTIYFTVSQFANDISVFQDGLATYISMSILPLCVISLPEMIVELKNSIILRRIKNAGFSKINFIFLSASFYFLVALLSMGITFILFFSFMGNQSERVSYINFGYLFYAILMLIAVAVACGIFLGSILKRTIAATWIGNALFFTTLMFSGQFIPLFVLAKMDAMRYITLFFPLNYSTSLINTVIYGHTLEGGLYVYSEMQNIFNFNVPLEISFRGSSSVLVYDSWQKGMNLIMPYFVWIGISIASSKYFNWYTR